MTQWRALSGTTAILLATTVAAQADVTGAEVWANWKAAAESMGQVITPGSETQAGDTLTVRDLKIAMDVPEMAISGAIASVEFKDRDDGAVTVTMSPSYTMMLKARPDTGETADIEIEIRQTGLTMVASGGDGEVAYDFLAPEVSISVKSLVVDGKPVDLVAGALISGTNGNYTVTEGDMTIVESRLDANDLTVKVAMKEPDGGEGNFSMTIQVADISASSAGSLAMMTAYDDLSQMLKAGFETEGSFSHGTASYAVDFVDGSDAFKMSASADSGLLDVLLNADEIGYAFSNSGLAVTMSGSDIPLPEIAFGLAEIGFGFLMPASVSDEPGEFGFGVTLDGLTVSDMIWSMVDAGGVLPHDPASLIVEISGKANWLVDVFDPKVAETMGEEVPAELHEMAIEELVVAVAGAELTGTGGFTFDNSDLTTFDGLPAPTGSIDLKLVGGNGLLDKLVAMGMIPEDEAMGARMMLGLFARPGDGEDTLVSKIEINGAEGSISANGQRLQ